MRSVQSYTPKTTGSVQAIQVKEGNEADIVEFCHGRIVEEHDEERSYVGVNVPTVDGVVRASEGDFIYRGRDRQTRVMKGDEFLEFYERTGVR